MRGASGPTNLFGGLYPGPIISIGEVWFRPSPRPIVCGSLALAIFLCVVAVPPDGLENICIYEVVQAGRYCQNRAGFIARAWPEG